MTHGQRRRIRGKRRKAREKQFQPFQLFQKFFRELKIKYIIRQRRKTP